MKQKTAIVRALKQRYDLSSVRFTGNKITGYIDDIKCYVADTRDMWTADHNGHSTRVYNRHIHISTLYGTVN